MENRGMMMRGSSDSLFDEHDFEVADILVNLSDSILKSEWNKAAVIPSWCVQKKRSSSLAPLLNSCTLQFRPPPSPLLPTPSALPPPVRFEAKKKSVEVNAEVASSPNSILLFPPASTELSESDEKSNLCLPRNSKKRREKLVEEIQGLNRSREMLRLEVEKVKSHYDKLLARNTQLKSLKQEALSSRAILQERGGCEQAQLEKPERKSSFGSDLMGPGQQWFQHIHYPTVMLDPQGRDAFQFIAARQVSQPLISYGFDPAHTWDYFRAKRAKYAEARMYRKNKRALK